MVNEIGIMPDPETVQVMEEPSVALNAESESGSSAEESDEETGFLAYSHITGNWFVQPNRKVAHLPVVCAGANFVPLCNSGEPFLRMHSQSGNGITALLAFYTICKKCAKGLPESTRAVINELLEEDEFL